MEEGPSRGDGPFCFFMKFLLLTHGAGSNRNAPLLVALANAFSEQGVEVLRYDLAFRQARAKGPPRPGDAARWIYNGKVVRVMEVQADGKVKERGLTAAQVRELPCYRCQRNF